MLKDLDLKRYTKVYIKCGYTDLRLGATGLLNVIQFQMNLDPFDQNAIFLFCGRRSSVIKALVTEDDGILVLSKRLLKGRYQWPRSAGEARLLSSGQYRSLISGFSIESAICGICETASA